MNDIIIWGFCILIALLGWGTISHIGAPNSGQHTGYVTAVEQSGLIWKTWRVYIKTDPQSSQEDSYCVEDVLTTNQLMEAEQARSLVTVDYSSPFLVWKWQCGGESSIVDRIEGQPVTWADLGSANGSSPTATNSGISGTLPTQVDQCDTTTISKIGTRLTDGTTGQDIAGSGSAINYTDGGYQVSYETVQGIEDSLVGDSVKLCLVSVPTGCPVGDDRGKVYSATNTRTGESWEAQDSEHSCGGA